MKRSIYNKPGLKRGLYQEISCTDSTHAHTDIDSDLKCDNPPPPPKAQGTGEDEGVEPALVEEDEIPAAPGSAESKKSEASEAGKKTEDKKAEDKDTVTLGPTDAGALSTLQAGGQQPAAISATSLPTPDQVEAQIGAAEPIPQSSTGNWKPETFVDPASKEKIVKGLPEGVTYEKGAYKGANKDAAYGRFGSVVSEMQSQGAELSPYQQQLLWNYYARQSGGDWNKMLSAMDSNPPPAWIYNPEVAMGQIMRNGDGSVVDAKKRLSASQKIMQKMQERGIPADLAAYAVENKLTIDQAYQIFYNGGGSVGQRHNGATPDSIGLVLKGEGPNPKTNEPEALVQGGDIAYDEYIKKRGGLEATATEAKKAYEDSISPGAEGIDNSELIAAQQAIIDDTAKTEEERKKATEERARLEAEQKEAVPPGAMYEQYQAADEAIRVEEESLKKLQEERAAAIANGDKQAERRLTRDIAQQGRAVDKAKKEKEKLDASNPYRQEYDKAQKAVSDLDSDMSDAVESLNTKKIEDITGVSTTLSGAGQASQKAVRDSRIEDFTKKIGLPGEVAGAITGTLDVIPNILGLPNKIKEAIKSERRQGLMDTSNDNARKADEAVAEGAKRRAGHRDFGEEGFVAAYTPAEVVEGSARARLGKASELKTAKERTEARSGVTAALAINGEQVSKWYSGMDAKTAHEEKEAKKDEAVADASDTSDKTGGSWGVG